MSERFQVVTANRLSDGAVVYAGPGGWVERLSEATLLSTAAEVEDCLAQARRDVLANRIILDSDDHNKVMAVVRENGTIRPLRMREIIRAAGPTVRPDLGKQAEP